MSNYKHLKEVYGKLPAEERLPILHHELMHPISTVRGYASLLSEIIESNKAVLPEEAKGYINKVLEASDALLETLNALTDT